MPGGHVQFAEDARAALSREIKEELGLDVNVGDPFYVFPYLSADRSRTVGIVFLASQRDESQSVRLDPRDNVDLKWVSSEDTATVFGSCRDHNFRAVVEGFARLRKVSLTEESGHGAP